MQNFNINLRYFLLVKCKIEFILKQCSGQQWSRDLVRKKEKKF